MEERGMSSTIYNHRSLQPTGPPTQGPGGSQPSHIHTRLNESLDVVRQEFEALAADAAHMRGQRDEFEAKLLTQITELNLIRSSLSELEKSHHTLRTQYDDEMTRMRAELHASRQGQGGGIPPPSHPSSAAGMGSVSQAQTPSQAPAQPPGLSSGGGGYGGDPYFSRERDRDRERDREREYRERERGPIDTRDPKRMKTDSQRMKDQFSPSLGPGPTSAHTPKLLPAPNNSGPGLPGGGPHSSSTPFGPGPSGPQSAVDRDRERERMDRMDIGRERERERERESRDPMGRDGRDGMGRDSRDPMGRDLMGRERDMGRDREREIAREREREREMRTGDRDMRPVERERGDRDAPGNSSNSNSNNVLPPPPQSSGHGGVGVSVGGIGMGFPDDMELANVPPELKKEGSDWFAVFSPKGKKGLDVSLVHTLMHESVVCCVRFSKDGKYVATGCNRTAQIYDTKTGVKTCVLVDESAGKAGDLYIRSVCFSPDGKLLATGAEDKIVRIWDIQKKRIRTVYDGHQQEIYSLDFSLDGRLIVSGSGDKTARIWDMSDGSCSVLTISDPDSLNNDAGVTSVAISPNGTLVAAGSLDTVVRIWDVATGQLVERLRGHRDSVYSVAFTPDGKGLVSGSLDKTLKY